MLDSHLATNDLTPSDDPEMREFEAALLRSVDDMQRGVFARTHTPSDIAKYKARGRPIGSTKTDTKQAVKIRFDPTVLIALRSSGRGWQTRVNGLVAEAVATGRF
jgi:uncharacterized protein (DUF4415 family)